MPHDPRTEQRVGAIVREELALFWEDLGQRFQKLGAGFRSALENYDSALQSFVKAWDLAQATPPEDPVRYDLLKRLTRIRSAAGGR